MKTFALVMAAALALSAPARAQVNIYIAGAVSLKDVAFNSITAFYGANLVSLNDDKPSKPTTANRLTFTGQMTSLFGSQTVNVYCNYNGGSGPAIQSLTQDTPISFFASAVQGATNLLNAPADIAFSVVFQKDYPYPTPVLSDTIYGATPSILVKSPLAPRNLTNLTSQNIRLLQADGAAPQSIFTASAADTNLLYWVMRDIGAAHRIIVSKEAGFTGSALAYVYSTNLNAWVLDPTGQTSWPVVINQLTNSYGPCVSFITPPDAPSIQPENILSFNGQFPFNGTFSTVSNDFTPVITGKYTCWGFEHILTKPNPAPDVAAFSNALIAAMKTNILTSPYSVPLSRMAVTRNATGGLVSPQ